MRAHVRIRTFGRVCARAQLVKWEWNTVATCFAIWINSAAGYHQHVHVEIGAVTNMSGIRVHSARKALRHVGHARGLSRAVRVGAFHLPADLRGKIRQTVEAAVVETLFHVDGTVRTCGHLSACFLRAEITWGKETIAHALGWNTAPFSTGGASASGHFRIFGVGILFRVGDVTVPFVFRVTGNATTIIFVAAHVVCLSS